MLISKWQIVDIGYERGSGVGVDTWVGGKWRGVANLVAETLIKRSPDACFTAYALIISVLAISASLMA